MVKKIYELIFKNLHCVGKKKKKWHFILKRKKKEYFIAFYREFSSTSELQEIIKVYDDNPWVWWKFCDLQISGELFKSVERTRKKRRICLLWKKKGFLTMFKLIIGSLKQIGNVLPEVVRVIDLHDGRVIWRTSFNFYFT